MAEDGKHSEVHRRAMRRFEAAYGPQTDIRAHALECRRFIAIPGAMWDGPFGEMFAQSVRVEIDKISRGVDKIVGDYRANRIVPDFRPAAGQGDQDTADTLDGVHRADSYHFKAQQARDNAFEEAAAGGMGAYRLANDYADPLDRDSDAQRINPALIIVDADQRVFFDPNSKTYDKHDAKWCIVLTADSKEAFEEEYPDKHTTWPAGSTQGTYDFFTADVIVKAEYYEVEEKKEQLYTLTLPLTGDQERWWHSEITDEELDEYRVKGWEVVTTRRLRRKVVKYVLSGAEVLEDCGAIAGDQIPVVPVYGKRWYVDNQERFRGYVSKRMDSQRIYNAKVSKLAETDALAPREKPIFDPEQLPPELQSLWQRQEVDRHGYALAHALRNEDGSIAHVGPIGKVEPPQVAPITGVLLQAANADLTEETNDGAEEVRANTSAEAMDIAASRIDAKSELYLDNMRQSVQREGEIYLAMAADCYYEPGRVVETMTDDGDDGTATIGEPFTDKNGTFRIRNDFSRGRYKVLADVTEATATRRDKTVKSALATADLAGKVGDMELAQASILTAIQNQDGEGMDSLKAFARKKAVAMGLEEPNEEERAAMEEQAAQPDPTAVLAEQQGKALEAGAAKDVALAGKAKADTELSEAKTVETLAKARQTAQEPPKGMMERFKALVRA